MKIHIEINKQTQFRKFHNFNEILEDAGKHAVEITRKITKIKPFKTYNISLLLCDDNEILRLNNDFRGKNYVTNVLSFEDGDVIQGVLYLGDIAMCIQKIYEEAALQSKTFRTHFIHLFIHGVLHLLGFDHEVDEERVQMEALEDEILLKLSGIQ